MPGEVAVEPPVPTPQEAEDHFSAAFAQLTKEDPPATTTEEKPAVAATEEKPAAAAATEEKPAGEAAATEPTAEEKAAAAAEAAKKPDPAKPDQTSEDMLHRLADLVRKPAEEPAQPQQQQVPQAPQLTEEETALVSSYVTDYPDIARAEAIIRKQEYAAVVAYVFAEVAREFMPLAQTVQTIASRTHLGDIQAAVPDYSTTRDQVVAWVEQQPAYLRTAYQYVIKQGSAEEVTDLINRYKAAHPAAATAADGATVGEASQTQATPPAKPATAAKPAQAAQQTQAELSPAAKRAVAALAPVQGKRSGAVQTEPTTYDDAFALAAKELEKL